MLFQWHRSTDKSIDFYFFVIVRELTITKSLVVEIQNLVVNSKSRPIKSNIERQILFKHVSSKNQ